MSDDHTAASSAVLEPTAQLTALTGEQRAEWRKTGTLPETLADSSPAVPAVPEGSTEPVMTPASEPGSPVKKKNAESRIQELLAERAQLRQELDAVKARPTVPDVSAVSSPAPVTGEKFPDYDAWSQAQGNESTDYEDYVAERTIHRFQQKQAVESAKVAQEAAQREEDDLKVSYRQSAETFLADHPDYWSVVNPITVNAPNTPTAGAIGDVILRSPQSTQLLYHLGTHRDEFDRLLALPERRAVYELAKLEASLTPSPAPAVPEPGRTTKTVSSAPAPVPTLPSKAQPPVDDVQAAVAEGDFRRYFRAANARDAARR